MPLAADNTAALCGKCHRETRDQLRTPPIPSDAFWATGDFRAAFESQHIGRVLRAYRNHPRHLHIFGKALNQELLGRWLGLTQAQVSKLENGKPEQDLKTLQSYAKVLHIPQSMLWFDLPGESRIAVRELDSRLVVAKSIPRQVAIDPAIAELCGAVLSYGEEGSGESASSISDLTHDLDQTFRAYQGSRFTIAASRASTLLADARHFAGNTRGEEGKDAANLLALSYHAASTVLAKYGHADLALVSADRGFQIASQLESFATRLSLTRAVAFNLLANNRHESAMQLIDKCAGSLTGADIETGVGISVSGTILLVGSLAAARFGDGARANDYLREADAVARRLGSDANFAWTAFGPTNVMIHRVNVAAELGDVQAIIKAPPLENLGAVPVERRVRYHLDVARALSSAGRTKEAVETLLSAERVAPEHVRRHYLSRKIADDLVRGEGHVSSRELELLADRMQLREIRA